MVEKFSHVLGRVATLSLDDLKSDEGQTTVEYAVVLVLVVLMATAVFSILGGGVGSVMRTITGQISDLVPFDKASI